MNKFMVFLFCLGYNSQGDKMKKILIGLVLCLCMCGCEKKEDYVYLRKQFIGPFDTITTYITYAKSEEDFNKQCEYIEEQLNYYDHIFDKYNEYDGINNVYTINQFAGKEAVKVDKALIDLVELCKERYHTISSKVNIAFGSVISIWHDYRSEAESNNGIGTIPSLDELNKANKHTDINKIIVDKDQQTIYIDDKETSLDVGATAKGYAIELIKDQLIEMGVESFILSGGGNVASYGNRLVKSDGSDYIDGCDEHYCVGIESPQDGNYSHEPYDGNTYDEGILVVDNMSVVTSGDYQRFYEDINGIKYHHLIDPDTLYPAVYFRSVSIVCEDSGLADFLSSTLFLMEYEDGLELVNSLEGVEALWLLEDGKIRMSDGLKDNENVYIFDKDRLK